jgi:L-seryl-tRNA(Ser) seleniumtransferase
MIAMTVGEIAGRVDAVVRQLRGVNCSADVIDGHSTIGGGSAPGSSLPTRLLALTHRSLPPVELEARLRTVSPPIVARIEHDRVLLDLRTVFPEQDQAVIAALRSL